MLTLKLLKLVLTLCESSLNLYAVHTLRIALWLEFCRCFNICHKIESWQSMLFHWMHDLSMCKILVSWKVASRIIYLILLDLRRPVHSVNWLKSVEMYLWLCDLNIKDFFNSKVHFTFLLLSYTWSPQFCYLFMRIWGRKSYFCTCVFTVSII